MQAAIRHRKPLTPLASERSPLICIGSQRSAVPCSKAYRPGNAFGRHLSGRHGHFWQPFRPNGQQLRLFGAATAAAALSEDNDQWMGDLKQVRTIHIPLWSAVCHPRLSAASAWHLKLPEGVAAPTTSQVPSVLQTQREPLWEQVSDAWESFMSRSEVKTAMQALQFAASLLFVILYVWSTYSTPQPFTWRSNLDLLLCAIFALDYLVRFTVHPPGS